MECLILSARTKKIVKIALRVLFSSFVYDNIIERTEEFNEKLKKFVLHLLFVYL